MPTIDAHRYTAPAIALHWLMALLLVGLFAVGLYMHELPLSPWKLKIYSWHKWAGVTAVLLVLARLAWRHAHRPPALPAAMPPPLRFAAHAGHAVLYVLMIAIPLSGWLMSSAKGFQTVWFGVLPLPDLVAKNEELGHFFEETHEALVGLLLFLLAAHVAATLKHHFVDRDDIAARMLPWLAKERK